MPKIKHADHPSAYLLADHLDAVLAAGEDVLTLRTEPVALSEAATASLERAIRQRRTVERLRALEFALIARLLQARARAQELAKLDERVRPVAALFLSGSAAFADAADDIGDLASSAFHTGHECIGYLRSRGLIAADAPGLGVTEELIISAHLLVAGLVPLAAIMDLVATFLDTLESFYELFDGDEASERAAIPAHEPHLPI